MREWYTKTLIVKNETCDFSDDNPINNLLDTGGSTSKGFAKN
jgi:hypothetical protein